MHFAVRLLDVFLRQQLPCSQATAVAVLLYGEGEHLVNCALAVVYRGHQGVEVVDVAEGTLCVDSVENVKDIKRAKLPTRSVIKKCGKNILELK